jgi:hypothetical protein
VAAVRAVRGHCGSILGVAATTAGWPLALMNDTLGRGRDAPTP